MEVAPQMGPSKEGCGEHPPDFPTWEYRIAGVGYSGLLTRYASIRLVHLVEGCDLRTASFRVRSSIKAIKRSAAKKMPVDAELLG